MTFFSGFSLRNEVGLFGEYLKEWYDNPYVVAGFSYGAIKAAEYAAAAPGRTDRLILLSPAWFLGRGESFIRAQLLYYRKDPEDYTEKFLQNAAWPSAVDLRPYAISASAAELESLLRYPWPSELFEKLDERGTRIEIYLGGRDRIVDAAAAHDFFKRYGTCYLFKPFGHLLR